MMKRILLCADDYGQAPAISQAILSLIDKNRLSATSCLVNSDDWPWHAKKLANYHPQIAIGLHLNFTEGKPLSNQYKEKYGDYFFPLPKLIKMLLFSQIEVEIFKVEGEAQLQRFIHHMGFLPDFLDGHHHIHQFTKLRSITLELYQSYLIGSQSFVRLVNPKLYYHSPAKLKKLIIIFLSIFFKEALIKTGIPHNTSFAGFYNFNELGDYRKHFLFFLNEINDKGLIMCHPGLSLESYPSDLIAEARCNEYEYLNSNQFLEDCAAHRVVISKFT